MKQTTILDEAIKEANISIACCLDEVSEVTEHDLEHIQKQIDIIEDEIKQVDKHDIDINELNEDIELTYNQDHKESEEE